MSQDPHHAFLSYRSRAPDRQPSSFDLDAPPEIPADGNSMGGGDGSAD
jgi:hypothetical protein